MEDLTSRVTHLWRLLKWGRTLARHGALRGIESDPLTPPQVRRLVRIARFGARIPPTPDYAAALRLMRHRPQDPEGFPAVMCVSATEGTGLAEAGVGVWLVSGFRVRPAAALTLALGAEYHRDANDDRALDGVIHVPYQNRLPSYAEGRRNIAAVSTELDLPVTANLSFNVAARHDDYSDFGGTSNPKASFRWQPTKQLMFRGSASTGFRAPTLFDRYGYRLPGATSLSTSKWDDPLLCPGTTGMAGTGTAVAG